MYKVLCARQQFSSIEEDDEEEEAGLGLGEGMPDIKNVASAYRAGIDSALTSPSLSKKLTLKKQSTLVGGMSIEQSITPSQGN